MNFLMFFVFWVFFWGDGYLGFWGGEESPQEIAGNNTGSFGRRAFAVAGSSEWNNLVLYNVNVSLRHAPSIESFKANLNTHLFRIYYG